MTLLDGVKGPGDLKGLSLQQLPQLCQELRQEITEVTCRNGGHLASSLGAVELIVALLRQYDLDSGDKILFDVGHQAYAYKLLTGRRDRFGTLRTQEGISGFLKRSESPYDFFGAGHSSTSLSAALGYAIARDLQCQDDNVVAVIGDGSIINGLALEALNHAGSLKTAVTFVLNDNSISINPPVGGMAIHLARLSASKPYRRFKDCLKKLCTAIPRGQALLGRLERLKTAMKQFLSSSNNVFDDMGLTYWGPFDGHDLEQLERVFSLAKDYRRPLVIHLITKKGKGNVEAELNPVKYHGVAPQGASKGGLSWSRAAASILADLAREDPRLVVLTPAMCEGSALGDFAKAFPQRFFDVGIAEEHMMTFAAALAAGGMRPVATIYSTFLQRAMDQLVHDVCLQSLPVIIAVDRAGFVGEDGETHQGLFDLGWCRAVANLTVWTPVDGVSLQRCFRQALAAQGPTMIRYPRGDMALDLLGSLRSDKFLHSSSLRSSWGVIALGPSFGVALEAQDLAQRRGIPTPQVLCLEQASPLPWGDLEPVLTSCSLVVTLEENYLTGGVGEALGAWAASRPGACRIKSLGVDRSFIAQATPEQQRLRFGLTAQHVLDCYESSL